MKFLKTKAVRNRILFTLFIVAVFYMGTLITLPGVKLVGSSSASLSNLLNITTGGALSQFGFLALGVSPYISASIVIQLLSKGVIPYYSRLNEQGQAGRTKLAQHTRYFAIFFGMATAFSILYNPEFSGIVGVEIDASSSERLMLAFMLTAGALFTTYLGEKIDEFGVGQGASVLIGFGVLSSLPGQVKAVYDAYPFYEIVGQTNQYFIGVGIVLAAYFVVFLLSLWANKKEYRFQIQSKQNSKIIKAHYFPIKLLASSVMPVIFSTSIISLITVLGTVFNYDTTWAEHTNPIGFAVYIGLILLFSYIYNTIQIDGEEISKNFNESGMYILGVSNLDTQKFINRNVLKITHKGAPILCLIAGIAIGVELFSPANFGLSLTGINILILIGVFQELIHQVKGLTEKTNYEPLL